MKGVGELALAGGAGPSSMPALMLPAALSGGRLFNARHPEQTAAPGQIHTRTKFVPNADIDKPVKQNGKI